MHRRPRLAIVDDAHLCLAGDCMTDHDPPKERELVMEMGLETALRNCGPRCPAIAIGRAQKQLQAVVRVCPRSNSCAWHPVKQDLSGGVGAPCIIDLKNIRVNSVDLKKGSPISR